MFGRKKKIDALERKVEDFRWELKVSDAKIDGLKSKNGLLRDRMNTLEKICQELTGMLEGISQLLEKEMDVTSKMLDNVNKMRAANEVHNEMRTDEIRTDEIRALRSMAEKLEQKMAELEDKRVPVLSDLTGGGDKKKPVSAKQIMDEWFNGKREGGEG